MSGSSFYNAPKAIKKRASRTCARIAARRFQRARRTSSRKAAFGWAIFWKRYSCRDCQPYISEFWGWQGCESESLEADFDEFMRENHYEEWVTDDDD